MTTEQHEEQASLYVLGLLEGQECEAFERELAQKPALRQLVEELRPCAEAVALSAPQIPAPADLRAELLERIADAKPVRPAFWSQAIPWAMAACFAVIAGWLYFQSGGYRDQIRGLEETVADLRKQDALSQMKIATLASQVADAPKAVGFVVWDPEKRRGVLTVEQLPAAAPSRDYQLWVIDHEPVSAGIIKVSNEGATSMEFRPDRPVSGPIKFAITLEPAGGGPKPQGSMVMQGPLRN